MENEKEITCPKCGSNKIHCSKVGFSGIFAVFGLAFMIFIWFALQLGIIEGIAMGAVGILAGTVESNDIRITCLKCKKSTKLRKL